MTPTPNHDSLQAKRRAQSDLFSLDSDRSRLVLRRDEVMAAIHRFQQIVREHEQFILGEEAKLKKLETEIAELDAEIKHQKRKLQSL